jgi:hypothetical protein
MPTAWEGESAVFSQLLAPLWDRGVGDAQLAGDLCHRLATGLSQMDRFSLKLCCIGLLNLLHDPFPPSGRVYPKISPFYSFGAGSPLLLLIGWSMWNSFNRWRVSRIGAKQEKGISVLPSLYVGKSSMSLRNFL